MLDTASVNVNNWLILNGVVTIKKWVAISMCIASSLSINPLRMDWIAKNAAHDIASKYSQVLFATVKLQRKQFGRVYF